MAGSRSQTPQDAGLGLEAMDRSASASPAPAAPAFVATDIEHAVVADDPRKWSRARKLAVLAVVSAASVIAGLAGNIYNPSISQIEEQLHASSGDISLSLSLFILIQGGVPLLWSALSEFLGRKRVYLLSLSVCTLGCIVAALSRTIHILIGMRCLQAMGSSAVISLGAATLADIYEPHERGTMMGIYYSAPLLGPSLGPILGGVLTQAFNWRATFWFLAIFTGLCFVCFVFFKDTYRKERSLVFQSALKRATAQMAMRRSAASSMTRVALDEKPDVVPSPAKDIEEGQGKLEGIAAPTEEVKVSLRDVNPIKPLFHVLRRMNNLTILTASGLFFAFSYCISYTCARTLANEYGYNALTTGLVLLSYGIGSLLGSVLGGRYSDLVFRKMKANNGGVSAPEMRLQSIILPALFLPPCVVAYGWVCEKHVHVAAICVMLVFCGFFSICMYSSTLAYIVDANNGRSSSAVACNSAFRGLAAFVATEVAVPLQESIGDGGLYSLWAGLMILAELLLLLVWWKGGAWREKWERRERGSASS